VSTKAWGRTLSIDLGVSGDRATGLRGELSEISER
jgi:hypothetical protein